MGVGEEGVGEEGLKKEPKGELTVLVLTAVPIFVAVTKIFHETKAK